MGVTVVIVALAVLMPLQQASGQTTDQGEEDPIRVTVEYVERELGIPEQQSAGEPSTGTSTLTAPWPCQESTQERLVCVREVGASQLDELQANLTKLQGTVAQQDAKIADLTARLQRLEHVSPKKWREDGQCGEGFPAADGNPAECDPDGIYPCCSPANWCGNTADHCDCPDCVDYRNTKSGSESREYISLGCWRDTSDRAIPTLEGTDPRLDGDYKSRENPIEKCYQVALSRGFPVFALQNGGWCAGSADGLNTYDRYGPSTTCASDGEGGPWGNEVYRITDNHGLKIKTSATTDSQSDDAFTIEIFSDDCDGIRGCTTVTISGLASAGTEYDRTFTTSNFGVPTRLLLTASGEDWLKLDWVDVYNAYSEQSYHFLCPNDGCQVSTDSSEGSRQLLLAVDGPKKWREDIRCGEGFPDEDGNPAECDPDSIYPCCSPFNWCGNTADHCDCTDCVDYRDKTSEHLHLTIRTSSSEYTRFPDPLTIEVFSDDCDGVCTTVTVSELTSSGTEYDRTFPVPIANFGVPTRLRLTASGDNWLKLGWVDIYNAYTEQSYRFLCPNDGCQLSTDSSEGSEQLLLAVDAQKKWREDFRCGEGYPAADGNPAECDPAFVSPCCSPANWCGSSPNHCDCPACVDYRNTGGFFINKLLLLTESCQEGNGTSYRGTVAVTETGRTCQRWDSQTPHGHNYTAAVYPSAGLEENYCRNAGDWAEVWCYTTDRNKRWERCDVPLCETGQHSVAIKTSRTTGSQSAGFVTIEIFSDDCDGVCTTITVTGLTDRGTEYNRTFSAANFGAPERIRLTASSDDWLKLDWVKVYNGFTGRSYNFPCPSKAKGCQLSTDNTEGHEHIDLFVNFCPEWYVPFRSGRQCFRFALYEKNYTAARADCEADGGHLAIPSDPGTNHYLVDQIKVKYPSGLHVWFGLTDLAEEGTWVWANGTPLGSGWSNWAPEQPDNAAPGGENCGHWTADNEYMWNDYECSKVTYYVCEVPALT
ncbi:uncharacterized protein LOC144884896 isoform X2 [Branchiostoma floridae x Branchiostoma japonicum]